MTARALARARLRDNVRQAVFDRSDGHCELQRRRDCIRGKLAFKGHSINDHGHLVPLEKGAVLSEKNCKWGCWRCALLPPHQSRPVTSSGRTDWTTAYYGN